MTILKLHFLDLVLVSAMSYLSYDLISHSNDYTSCYHPINYWLLIVYIILVVIRFTINIVMNSDYLCLVKLFRFYLICIVIPFLLEWTVQGTIWYVDIEIYTPTCIPTSRLPLLIIWWLVVCYLILVILIGLMIYEICTMVRKRRINQLIQNVLNTDNPYLNLAQLNNLMEEGNVNPDDVPLTQREIKLLKRDRFIRGEFEEECSICCENLENNTLFISFFNCKHFFHANCIEQWLIKKPVCPNCKRNIRSDIMNSVNAQKEKKNKDFMRDTKDELSSNLIEEIKEN